MYRAGLGFLAMWGVPSGYRFSYFFMNLEWHAMNFGKALVWPVVLALWLARGRPESPWTVVGNTHGVPLVRHAKVAVQVEDKIEDKSKQPVTMGSAFDPIDNSLPDDEWLARSKTRFEEMIKNYYGSCETIGQGGQERYGYGDVGTALFFYQKSIDVLHTNYLFLQMSKRQPSPADAWIVNGYTSSLGASLAMHPTAPVDDSVREVTHRLRTIAAACDQVGLPSQLYREGLRLIAQYAPHVNLDDVLG